MTNLKLFFKSVNKTAVIFSFHKSHILFRSTQSLKITPNQSFPHKLHSTTWLITNSWQTYLTSAFSLEDTINYIYLHDDFVYAEYHSQPSYFSHSYTHIQHINHLLPNLFTFSQWRKYVWIAYLYLRLDYIDIIDSCMFTPQINLFLIRHEGQHASDMNIFRAFMITRYAWI